MKYTIYILLLLALLSVFAAPALTQDGDMGDWDKSPFTSPVSGTEETVDFITRGHVSSGDAKAEYTATYDVLAVLDEFRQAITGWLERAK